MDNSNEILKIVPAYLQVIAIFVAGIWAYWKFIYQREKEPAADIDIDIRFVSIQNDKWIIEVTACLENKGLVRLTHNSFQVSIRYLVSGDKIEDGNKKINYQLNCAKTIDERINGEKRLFSNVKYINPRQEFKYRYITFIDKESSFIWVQCKFEFTNAEKSKKMNSQRIFKVPSERDDD